MNSYFAKTLPADRTLHSLSAAQAQVRQRMSFSPSFGEGVATAGKGQGPVRLGWQFEAQAGACEVWVRYASAHSRPVRLLLNGTLVHADALRDRTFGNKPSAQAWVYQGLLTLAAGTNELLLEGDDEMPFVGEVALLDTTGPRPASLDERRATALPARAALLEDPAALASLVRSLAPMLRRELVRGSPAEEIQALVGELLQAIDEDLADPQARLGFRGPLNGQLIRQAIFVGLDRLLRFDVFLETGSYLGTTTEMLASYERPVYSCESKLEFYLRAAARLAALPQAQLFHQDSRRFLQSFVARHAPQYTLPLCYLDAHWYDDLPLPDEIRIIRGAFQRFVIMVDDFKHPQFDYPFDRYPTGIELTLDYLLPRLGGIDDLAFFFPALPETLETGPRRGTLVITPLAMAAQIGAAGLPLVRHLP